VGYITAQYLNGQPVRLHYAFQSPVDRALSHPYYFPGTVQSVDATSDSAGTTLYQAVTFSGPAPSAFATLTAVSAATFLPGALAPGSIVAAFGSRLSTDTQAPPAGEILIPQPSSTVTIRDSAGVARTASQYSASPAQVNFLLPALTAPGSATLTVTAQDGVISSTAIQVAPVAPGIFQLDPLTGLAAANVVRVKADQSQSILDRPQIRSI
jgi:hypothetical protein